MLPRRRFLRLACAPLLAPLARPSTGLALPSPYLQDVRPDRATVSWLAEEESPRYSFAGASLKDSTTLRLAPSETGLDRTIYVHRTIMGALEPAQEYRYALESASVPSAGIQFRTPARSSRVDVLHTVGDATSPQSCWQAILSAYRVAAHV